MPHGDVESHVRLFTRLTWYFRSDRDQEWALLQAIKDIDDFRIPRPRWYDATGEYLGCKCIVSEAIESTSMQKYLDA